MSSTSLDVCGVHFFPEPRLRDQSGFTLIELLAAILIVGILTAMKTCQPERRKLHGRRRVGLCERSADRCVPWPRSWRPESDIGSNCEHLFVAPIDQTSGATVLHADLDAFFASVEQRDNPALRGKPVLVGGGIVTAASYEARARGVSTPMNLNQARAICPDAVVVSPRGDAYAAASRQVMAVLEDFSPTVEKISIDEAFLDGAGMEHIHGTPREIAEKIRAAVLERTGLKITIGVARTKFLAKIASGAAKPDGLLVVEPEGELDFLHPLPIEAVWGVGRVTSKKLRARGVRTVGDIAALDVDTLCTVLGRSQGRKLHALSNNRDERRVAPRQRRKSIGAQRAISKQPRSRAELETILASLVDRVTPRLRGVGRSSRTVVLSIRFGDFTRITRSHTLGAPTTSSDEFLMALKALLGPEMDQVHELGITLIGVALANLDDGAQLELAFDGPGGNEIDATVDAVKERFGKNAIQRGAMVGKDSGFAAPQVED
ncbi:MAG: DNA polymerase IV [Solirubrobacterales bacterium]